MMAAWLRSIFKPAGIRPPRIYLAIFDLTQTKAARHFPHVPGGITEGDTLDETMNHTKEALELQLWGLDYDGDILPPPSRPEQIALPPGPSWSLLTPGRISSEMRWRINR